MAPSHPWISPSAHRTSSSPPSPACTSASRSLSAKIDTRSRWIDLKSSAVILSRARIRSEMRSNRHGAIQLPFQGTSARRLFAVTMKCEGGFSVCGKLSNGIIPFDSLPHTENPPSHFIVTANNRLADVPWNGSWIAPWRFDRISDLIRARDKMTADDFKSIQRDRVSIFALKLRDALVQAGDGGNEDVRWALGEIRGWDGAMTENSRPAAIVAATEVTMAQRVFKPRSEE